MANSERISQIGRIIREVKEEVCKYPDEGVSCSNFNLMVNEKIKLIADELNITEGTCANKVTREIGIRKKEIFKEELWDFFVDKTPAIYTKLGQRILSNRTSKDKRQNVIDMLVSIKNY